MPIPHLKERPGGIGSDFTLGIAEVRRAVRGRPYELLPFALRPPHVVLKYGFANLKSLPGILHRHAYATGDVLGLHLGVVDYIAGVAEIRTGPVHHVKVRKLRDHDTQISAGTVLPELIELDAARALDHHRREKILHLKSGREDNHVRLMNNAGSIANSHGRKRLDGFRDQVDI